MLGEMTKEIQSEWSEAYNPSGFRHGVSEAPIYLYRELANGLVSVLARAIKTEWEIEHQVDCQGYCHGCGCCVYSIQEHSKTDADWLAEAEKVLRG